ncbi:inactive protein RESTRICTED TEV MOVEMENT 2-like [Phoenix dactylifera]|uniref:Inactive protein RESTRICTED TEV MOVEMENT 2-like n=1 Tax=Phoenix dactylifera TaxID=42345 RepID=A0A8B7CW18_PHODC|nr:inactive protein RESTRICTED TEV MOVEMENT 2-like [Phoenix dactylifera]
MDTRPAASQRVYEDFIPSHELVQEEGAGTLILEIPGYRKDQLRVQINNYGKIRISGERPLGDNRWNRFRKDFQVPENCNVSEIRAKFENGHLYVILPKLIPEVRERKEPTQAPDEKPTAIEPKPSTRQDEMNHKASVEPNGVAKKQEDEKKGEPMDARKEVQKVGEKEKDQTEEKQYKEKVTGVVEREEGEKGDAVTEGEKKEAVRNGVSKLVGELGSGFYKPSQIMVNIIAAAVVLVGVGLYVTYKRSRPMEEDGH